MKYYISDEQIDILAKILLPEIQEFVISDLGKELIANREENLEQENSNSK